MESAKIDLSPGVVHQVVSTNIATSRRGSSLAVATPAPRISKEVALRPIDHKLNGSNGTTINHGRLSLDSVHSVTKLDLLPSQHAVDMVDGIINGNAMQLGVPHSTTANSNMKMHLNSSMSMCAMIPAERDIGTNSKAHTAPQSSFKAIPHRPVSGPEKLTIRSTLVKSQPPMLSAKLSNHHRIVNTTVVHGSPMAKVPLGVGNAPMSPDVPHQPPHPTNRQTMINTRSHNHGEPKREFHPNVSRPRDYHSSSDENRSSGHASMSDTGHRSNSPGLREQNGDDLGQPRDDRFLAGVSSRNNRNRASTGHPRPRHRASPAKVPWKGSGLEDIKMAIQQLTMRSQTSTSTYSSVSAGSESSEPTRRLARYSSLETINTNVTTADEFVWVDSHNRLVEIQSPPWNQQCIFRVIRTGRCREHAERITPETVPRLSYLLQRVLVRIAREVQRLSSHIGLCSKHEISGAFKIILCPALSDSCIKACLRAAAMFGVPGDSALRQSKSNRAGLQLPIGRFHRWMCDARLGRFVHEYAAVYFTAGMENLLEEILLLSMPADATVQLTASLLDNAIGNNGDLWGLLQPYAHLNAGRISTGALTIPSWPNQFPVGTNSYGPSATAIEPSLLITCVGSATELRSMVLRAQNKFNQCSLSSAALATLFYFMRCSQLEHNEGMVDYYHPKFIVIEMNVISIYMSLQHREAHLAKTIMCRSCAMNAPTLSCRH